MCPVASTIIYQTQHDMMFHIISERRFEAVGPKTSFRLCRLFSTKNMKENILESQKMLTVCYLTFTFTIWSGVLPPSAEAFNWPILTKRLLQSLRGFSRL